MIEQLLPNGFVENSELRFIDPFLGGGAMPLAIQGKGLQSSRLILSDVNEVLISTYRHVIETDEGFYAHLEVLQMQYKNTPEKESLYFNWRQEFNELRNLPSPRRSALFVALNRTCFNGLWRENATGEFNVPFGRLSNPSVFDVDRLFDVRDRLKGATLLVRGFQDQAHEPRPGDVVFLDPPYLPLSGAVSFETYSKGGFGTRAHVELNELITRWVRAGVHVVLCNSDSPETRKIYRDSELRLYSHRVGRSVGASPKTRAAVQEIIAVPNTFQIESDVLDKFCLTQVEPDGELQ